MDLPLQKRILPPPKKVTRKASKNDSVEEAKAGTITSGGNQHTTPKPTLRAVNQGKSRPGHSRIQN